MSTATPRAHPATACAHMLLERVAERDADGLAALFTEDGRVRDAEGELTEGRAAIRRVAGRALARLRSVAHEGVRVHPVEGGAWLEADATFVLDDWGRLGPVPFAVALEVGDAGLVREARGYGVAGRRIEEHERRSAAAGLAVLPWL